FLAWLQRAVTQQAGLLQHPINAGRADRHHVAVEHHEGQPAIALQGILAVELLDRAFLLLVKPVVPRHPGVVLVDLPEALAPVMELASGDAQPAHEALLGDLGLLTPGADEIDDRVARVGGRPAAVQISPSSFFKATCSSMSSPRTASLRCSLASRALI